MADYIEGAEWWKARSIRSVRMLMKAFDQQEVACCLYERTGAMVQLGRVPAAQMPADEEGRRKDGYLIAIQVVRTGRDDWDVDLTLSEIGVILDEQCEGPQ
jgi:hypothetical protein